MRNIRVPPWTLAEHGSTVVGLAAADPAALLRSPGEVASPVLQVVLERARTGSRPRARTDDHRVYLAVEGGGMRGAVSAGMCVLLEAAGLVDAFDRIYGVSAGTLNAWGTAAGQAALSATCYQDAASRRVINPLRPLIRQPVIDFDVLFEELIAARKPLPFDALRRGPELCALATSLESRSLRVLSRFAGADEVVQAVRASMALPRLGGSPCEFRGERMADGALLEPIPFATALEEGATHVLVLRSRSAGYRRPALAAIGESVARQADRELQDLLRRRHGVYNRQAEALERGVVEGRGAAHIHQITIPDRARVIGRFENNGERVTEALRIGATSMASAVLTESIDLCWQPVVYRTTC